MIVTLGLYFFLVVMLAGWITTWLFAASFAVRAFEPDVHDAQRPAMFEAAITLFFAGAGCFIGFFVVAGYV